MHKLTIMRSYIKRAFETIDHEILTDALESEFGVTENVLSHFFPVRNSVLRLVNSFLLFFELSCTTMKLSNLSWTSSFSIVCVPIVSGYQ